MYNQPIQLCKWKLNNMKSNYSYGQLKIVRNESRRV